jgi:predicted CXXCH cytochrome family protein
MKKSITKTMLLVMIAMVSIMMAAQIAKAGISVTKHNLSFTGPGTLKASDGQQNNEICIYCHTPHFASSTVLPLWNKAVQGTTYTMYGTTVAGNTPDATPGGITKACLSCHDGVNGINSIVNQAGVGNVVSAGTLVPFGATVLGTAALISGSATTIGSSLTNDHPVSIAYSTTAAGLKATTTTLTGWVGATTIANLLRNNKVECSSCHDPHSSANEPFLRVANTGSALCIGCHDK